MIRYVHTNIIARNAKELIDFYKNTRKGRAKRRKNDW